MVVTVLVYPLLPPAERVPRLPASGGVRGGGHGPGVPIAARFQRPGQAGAVQTDEVPGVRHAGQVRRRRGSGGGRVMGVTGAR